MGLIGYYCRFVENLSRITNPITTLQKKGIKFVWSQQYQDSFDKLNHLLTTTPILIIFYPNKDFVVCTYASKDGLGCVLTQYRHVSFYESRKLKEHEKNYRMHDMELAVIIHALKIWQRYLVGKKFLLLTQNVGLKYGFDQNAIKVSQDKWLPFWSEYDFEIKNIKGKENIVENSLS